jgi:hypothetical protein
MIRYYFDIVIDDEVVVDDEGSLLADVEAARREAAVSLAEIARTELRSTSRLAISVRTDDGPVCEAAFQWNSKSLH